MIARELFVNGTRLHIYHEQEQRSYTAAVLGSERSYFSISPPGERGAGLEMPPGSVWRFCLVREDGLYHFTSTVLGRFTEPLTHYRVSRPAATQRQQRRQYVRLACRVEVIYWNLEQIPSFRSGPEEPGGKETGPPGDSLHEVGGYLALLDGVPGIPAYALDLSGGGIRLLASQKLPQGSRLLLEIRLDDPGTEVLLAEGKVTRVSPLEEEPQPRYRVGVSFSAISRGVRERIIRYVFKRLRSRAR